MCEMCTCQVRLLKRVAPWTKRCSLVRHHNSRCCVVPNQRAKAERFKESLQGVTSFFLWRITCANVAGFLKFGIGGTFSLLGELFKSLFKPSSSVLDVKINLRFPSSNPSPRARPDNRGHPSPASGLVPLFSPFHLYLKSCLNTVVKEEFVFYQQNDIWDYFRVFLKSHFFMTVNIMHTCCRMFQKENH